MNCSSLVFPQTNRHEIISLNYCLILKISKVNYWINNIIINFPFRCHTYVYISHRKISLSHGLSFRFSPIPIKDDIGYKINYLIYITEKHIENWASQSIT